MNPPANWYPDPTGRHGQRYWDGEQWTEHVFTDGVQGVDPLDATGATGAASEAEDAEDAEQEPAAELAAEEPAAEAAAEESAAEPEASDEPVPAADLAEDAVALEVVTEDVVGTADFSDAFMVAPETVSRLVARGQDAVADDAAGEPEVEETGDEAREEVDDDEPTAAAAKPADAAEVPTGDEPPVEGAIDAPPPAMPAPAFGITGDLVGGAFAEREDAGPVALQNARLLRCTISPGTAVIARQGTMVAYQGDVSFERQGAGGVGRALKRAATGEGLAMMRAEGTGDVFLADGAQHAFLLHLEGGAGLSVNGRNVLAFSADLDWDIERVKGATLLAGGLFNTTLTGTGWVALVSDGEPVVLRTDDAPTYVDVNALVAWSGGLTTRIVNTVSAKSVVGFGSGEAFQMAFDGAGIVIVQPSEGSAGGTGG